MRFALLSGGIGGAKLARGFDALDTHSTTVIVNVGDDDEVYGLSISPDVDTVMYTLAGCQGPLGWGRHDDTTTVMEELARFGVETSFTLGDRDLALNLFRSERLRDGTPLSRVTASIAESLGVRSTVLPVTDDRLRTQVRLAADGTWIDFQTYFVRRRHADRIAAVRFDGAGHSRPAPGVLEAISEADAVVIGPSNPVLSVWPILAVPGVEDALADHERVFCVSPLIGGKAVKGPAAEVMEALGIGADLSGVLTAYRGKVTDLVVDTRDRSPDPAAVSLHRTDTLIPTRERAIQLAEEIVSWC